MANLRHSGDKMILEGYLGLDVQTAAPAFESTVGFLYIKAGTTNNDLFFSDGGSELQIFQDGVLSVSKIYHGDTSVDIATDSGPVTIMTDGVLRESISAIGAFDIDAASWDLDATGSIDIDGNGVSLNSEGSLVLSTAGSSRMEVDDSGLFEVSAYSWSSVVSDGYSVTAVGSLILATSTLGTGDIYIDSNDYLYLRGTNYTYFQTGTGNTTHAILDSSGNWVFYDSCTLSTGGETAPDVDAGGICLDQNAADDNILTMKSSDVSHAFTSDDEADTYATFKKFCSTYGGLQITGYNAYSSTSEDAGAGLYLRGCTAANITDTSTDAFGAVTVSGCEPDSNTAGNMGSGENVFVVHDFKEARFIVKNDGDLYTDSSGGALGEGDAVVRYYDKEDDIELSRAAQRAFAGFKDPSMRVLNSRLEELGIVVNGFVCHQGVMALNLGTNSQLWNIMRGIGRLLGLPESSLKILAKDYDGDVNPVKLLSS